MNKGDLKLISARIDEESYEKISNITHRHPYWKKNYVIRRILSVVLNHFNDGQIYDMLCTPDYPIQQPKCEYRYPYVGDDSKK